MVTRSSSSDILAVFLVLCSKAAIWLSALVNELSFDEVDEGAGGDTRLTAWPVLVLANTSSSSDELPLAFPHTPRRQSPSLLLRTYRQDAVDTISRSEYAAPTDGSVNAPETSYANATSTTDQDSKTTSHG